MSRMLDRSSTLHLKLSRLPNALGSVRSETAIASFTRRDQNGLGLDSFEPFVDGSVQNLRDGLRDKSRPCKEILRRLFALAEPVRPGTHKISPDIDP